MDNIIKRTIKNLNCLNRKYDGCSVEEIEAIKAGQNVTELPTLYNEFLETIGKGAQGLYVGTNIYYDDNLYKLKDFANELLQESESNFELPENAFVFAMHQGYQFLYFLCEETDDPTVFYYIENLSAPEKKYPSLTEFFKSTIYFQ